MFSSPRIRRAQSGPAPRQARVVALFGCPGVGCSSVAEVLRTSSMTPIAVVPAVDGGPELSLRVERAAGTVGPSGCVIIDGSPACRRDPDGHVTGPDMVQYLYDRRLVYPGAGLVVQVAGPTKTASEAALVSWLAALPETERRIQLLGLDYRTVQNERGEDGLITAASSLAAALGMR